MLQKHSNFYRKSPIRIQISPISNEGFHRIRFSTGSGLIAATAAVTADPLQFTERHSSSSMAVISPQDIRVVLDSKR